MRSTDLHRDADGHALLVGPDCDMCGLRSEMVYGCTACSETFKVFGRYVWEWQGKGHRFRADDETAWAGLVAHHTGGHSPRSVVVIASALPKSGVHLD